MKKKKSNNTHGPATVYLVAIYITYDWKLIEDSRD